MSTLDQLILDQLFLWCYLQIISPPAPAAQVLLLQENRLGALVTASVEAALGQRIVDAVGVVGARLIEISFAGRRTRAAASLLLQPAKASSHDVV